MKLLVCSVALASLGVVVVRQGHEVKNGAYRQAELLTAISRCESRKLGLMTTCCREGSPATLVERMDQLQIVLVHPFARPASPRPGGAPLAGTRLAGKAQPKMRRLARLDVRYTPARTARH